MYSFNSLIPTGTCLNALSNHTLKCHECALCVNISSLVEHQKAICPRCGFVLSTRRKNAIDRMLAFSVTALIFFFLSLPFEFLAFKANGLERKIDLLTSLTILIENDYTLLAIIEVLTIFAIPFIVLSLLIYCLVFLRQGKYPRGGHAIMNIINKLLPWSMVEIFVIGVLVSLIKIISMATIGVGISFVAFLIFSIFMTAVIMHIDKHQLYSLLKIAQQNSATKKHIVNSSHIQQVSHVNQASKSVQTTWALLLTSIVFYIPANLLPIMSTRLFGQDDPSTILGGVILLWHMGSYPIAMIIFIASVFVPMAKILVLIWLNYSVQKQQHALPEERLKLYRIAELVGRWSMVDVYVVIILVSLIQLGNTMSIYPGGAVLAFSGVVITTMLAAMSFNPQLIWQKNNYKVINHD